MQKIKFKAVFFPFILGLFSAKLRSNVDFDPQNFKAVQTLPHKMTKPLYFAPQNNKAFILCSAKFKKKNANFALQNHRGLFSGAKITTKIICLSNQ